MIKYTLKCAQGHCFESWFKSSTTFDELQRDGMLACVVCSNTDIDKALMTPQTQSSESKARALAQCHQHSVHEHTEAAVNDNAAALLAYKEKQRLLKKLRTFVESKAEYKGQEFALEARRIANGDAPHRMIWGEATLAQAVDLWQDDISVLPLPFTPIRKLN